MLTETAELSDHSGGSSIDNGSRTMALDDTSTGSQSSSIHGSASSHDSINNRRKATRRGSKTPRRGRRPVRDDGIQMPLRTPDGRFQCTFCTETFRTKYDWARHEKSLHVPLERWLCSPDGLVQVDLRSGQDCCIYCGKAEPDDGHIAAHNPHACKQRVFNRKDHLKQHLRLVHDADGVEWIVRRWKAPSLDIRSRCGFCGITLNTWIDREDHLADHFKLGQTMADWTGDWGFEKHVMDTVENFMPPCESRFAFFF